MVFYYYLVEVNWQRKFLLKVEADSITIADKVFSDDYKIDPKSTKSSIVVTLKPH